MKIANCLYWQQHVLEVCAAVQHWQHTVLVQYSSPDIGSVLLMLVGVSDSCVVVACLPDV
jgi:hypothetical protein